MNNYNQKPWFLKESEAGPSKVHVGFENILENVVNKPLLWCDECHYYHNTIKDCPYNTGE